MELEEREKARYRICIPRRQKLTSNEHNLDISSDSDDLIQNPNYVISGIKKSPSN